MAVVFKLGGSLLDLADLVPRLQKLILSDYAACSVLAVVGGGQVVDAVRHYDSIHHFQEDSIHWLCVDLMNSTAAMFQQLSNWRLLNEAAELEEWLQSGSTSSCSSPTPLAPAIVAPSAFYSRELNSTALPRSWSCTSDSIAALLAQVVDATELVMLKSTDASTATNEPLMDESFADIVPRCLKVRVVNLRESC